MYDQQTGGMATTKHRSLVERCRRKDLSETLQTHNKKKQEKKCQKKSDIHESQEKIRAHRASSKATRVFLTKYKSNINQSETFACPAVPYKNCKGEADTKNQPNWYFVLNQKKGPNFDPHVSNLRSREFLFWGVRPTQSIMYVPLQVNRFHKSILLIVQYKYEKSCSGFYSPESDPLHKIMLYWFYYSI